MTEARDPALYAALDVFTAVRAHGTPAEMLAARSELVRLLGVVEDDGRFEQLKARAERRRAEYKAQGDMLGLRVAERVLKMVRDCK